MYGIDQRFRAYNSLCTVSINDFARIRALFPASPDLELRFNTDLDHNTPMHPTALVQALRNSNLPSKQQMMGQNYIPRLEFLEKYGHHFEPEFLEFILEHHSS